MNNHHTRQPRFCLAILGVLGAASGLAGCDLNTDPYSRTDVWRPEGANIGNLAAMLVNPLDLVHGQAATGPSIKLSSIAVVQLWRGQSVPLQQEGTTSFTPPAGGGAGAGAGAGAPPGAGGAPGVGGQN